MRTGNRRCTFGLHLAILLLIFLLLPAPTPAQATDCTGYDSQIWAQSVYEADPVEYAALDPDANGLACEELFPGAAPALWTTETPGGAEPATLVGVTDSDTIEVITNGQDESVRLSLIDAPETNDQNVPPECFGQEAVGFLEWLLSLGGDLYLEPDTSDRDQDGRLLRYAWLDFGNGEVYLVNEAMVRSGFAAASSTVDDAAYGSEIRVAEAFAREHGYGFWGTCGGPHEPISETEAPAELEVAQEDNGCGGDRPNPDTICPQPSDPTARYIEYLRANHAPDGVQIRLTEAGVNLGQTCAGAGRLATMVSDLYRQLPAAERVSSDLAWTDPYLTREIRAHSWAAASGIPGWASRGNPVDVVFADYTSPGHADEEWEDILAQSLMDCGGGS